MTNPISGMQAPHAPTVIWAVGIALAFLVIYHLIHRHG